MHKIKLLKNVCRKLSRHNSSKVSSEWKSVVGLEIHAQIASESKLFSGARNSFGAEINSSVALLDAGIPGCLPVLNKRCVEAGVKTALALKCQINEVSMFDRKHYFYGDLPTGYQITQQRAPLASSGTLNFPVLTPTKNKMYYKQVRLHQLQLEQDSGKSLHDDKLGISLIDLNRAGVPLMELVFDPELTDGEEAAALVKELILIFSAIGTCSCKMEEGALRVDANVSIHKQNEPFGVRTEIKNIGSVRGVANAIEYEIERQKKVKDEGGEIINETRQWDANNRVTVAMRDKEVVQDYRYMPEPNLLPLHLNMSSEEIFDDMVNVKVIEKTIPSLPKDLRDELMNVHNLPQITAIILVNEPFFYKMFQATINPQRKAKVIANVLINELLTACNSHKIEVEDCKISSAHFGEIIDMLESGELNLNLVKLVLDKMLTSDPKSPREISDENDWKQISDENEILKFCKEVLETDEGQKMAKLYKSGKSKLLLAIAGEINKKSNKRINMAKTMEILKELLK